MTDTHEPTNATDPPALAALGKPTAGMRRATGNTLTVESGFRHIAGNTDVYRPSRCRCLGARPRQQCHLDFTGPDGVCDACRTHCRAAWRMP